jgi:putative SOS response-associated peptidase YedK
MCGRYTLRTKLNVLLSQFAAELAEGVEWQPRYNIPPTAPVPIVRLAEGKRQLALAKWGLIPSWAKDTKIAFSTINSRADTVATKPAFRAAYKKRRCLVLADGYFEWEAQGKAKLPWLYEVDGGKPFAFAGLWEQWWGNGEDKPPVETCTIITTDPNELAATFHDRMPVILDDEDYDAWMQGEQIPLVAFPQDRMSARPVSTFVNSVKNQGPECIAPRGEEPPAIKPARTPKGAT